MSDITFTPGVEKDEAKYQRLEYLSSRLGLPAPTSHIGLELTTSDGEVLYKEWRRSRTWNRNFWTKTLAVASPADTNGFGPGHTRVKSVVGTTGLTSTGTGWNNYKITHAPTDGKSGIVVGSSNTAESFEAYTMGALIANGSGAGQLLWGTTYVDSTVSYNAPTKKWTRALSRNFTNASGSTITVRELGLQALANTEAMLVCRDVLSSEIAVGAGMVLKVTYTMSMVFPA